jgi:hypothetical protein
MGVACCLTPATFAAAPGPPTRVVRTQAAAAAAHIAAADGAEGLAVAAISAGLPQAVVALLLETDADMQVRLAGLGLGVGGWGQWEPRRGTGPVSQGGSMGVRFQPRVGGLEG